MSGHLPFNNLRAQMPADRRARNDAAAESMNRDYEITCRRLNSRLLSSFREADLIEADAVSSVSFKSGKDVILDCLTDVSSS